MKSTIFKALTLTIALGNLSSFGAALPNLESRKAAWDKMSQEGVERFSSTMNQALALEGERAAEALKRQADRRAASLVDNTARQVRKATEMAQEGVATFSNTMNQALALEGERAAEALKRQADRRAASLAGQAAKHATKTTARPDGSQLLNNLFEGSNDLAIAIANEKDITDAVKRDHAIVAKWTKNNPIVKKAGMWATVVGATKAGAAVAGAAISAPYIFGKKLVLHPQATWQKHGAASTILMGIGTVYCGYLACKGLNSAKNSILNWWRKPAQEKAK